MSLTAYSEIMEFVAKHLSEGFYINQTTQAISSRDVLFREAITNILIHREFSDAFVSKIVIGKDEVLFENACTPSFIGKINLDAFLPESKNPTIARVFRLIGRADELGSGIRNMKKYNQVYSGGIPEIYEGDIFRTIIPLKTKEVVQKVYENQIQIILKYLQENESISNKEIRESLSIEKSRATELLHIMMEKGFIIRVGNGRNTRYYSKEKIEKSTG